MLVGFSVLVFGGAPAAADDAPRVPEEVAEYFATGLLPRLNDLYGPGVGGEPGIDFDESTAAIGPITRVMVWTQEFRAGNETDLAVELSNNWVAPISAGGAADGDAAESSGAASDEVHLGVATVWISPHTNAPELASFIPSAALGPALAAAPEGSLLVHDAEQDSWYALAGAELTLLAQGGEAVTSAPLSLRDAQQTLWHELETLPGPQANSGFVVAGLTLAFVVVLLAIFVLVPDRRRTASDPEMALGFEPSSDRRKP